MSSIKDVPPAPYTSHVTVAFSSDETFKAIVGEGLVPAETLNVFKTFSETEEMWPGILGLV